MSKKELDHLYISKNERMGIIILFILLLILIVIPWLYYKADPLILKKNNKEPALIKQQNEEPKYILNSKQTGTLEPDNHLSSTKTKVNFELTEFDPNHLEANEAKKLGINDKSYHILQNYLATGARIRSTKQFRKIYGISDETFKRLEPYIKIKEEGKKSTIQNKLNAKSLSKVDLNSAEADEIMRLPGIGEKLASRIIKYRNLLGGFTKETQLNEIYGLQDSTIQKFLQFISISDSVKKINLNTEDYEELKKHPYIGAQKARMICEYRKRHPAIENLKDLYKIQALDSNWIQRISAYLNFE